MAKVEQTVQLNASADQVWEVIGNFSDLGWYPGNRGMQTETVDGKLQRVVPLPGGAELREQQEDDRGSHSYSYTIASGPLPVSDYLCSLRVEPDGNGTNRSIVTWSSTFEPVGVSEDQAVEIVSGVYKVGLKALKDRF